MADLIDRNEVLETIFNVMSDNKVVHKHRALNRNIKQIPPTDTERHAHWVKTNDDNFICSNCRNDAPMYKALLDYDNDYYEILTDFCPNCGCLLLVETGV